MNIWICNPCDPLPGEGLGELRYARLARALLEQGHRVTWWSADWSHTLKRRRSRPRGDAKVGKCESEKDSYSGCHDQELITGKLETGKLKLVLLPVPAYLKNISLRRIWSHRCYARGISKRADAHAAEHGKPDLILFSVPPMEAGAVALRMGKRYGAKVVLDVMDAWPQALALGLKRSLFFVPRSLASVVLYPYTRMMRRYCRDVDAVCAQSQAFGEYARSFGATGEGSKRGRSVYCDIFGGGTKREVGSICHAFMPNPMGWSARAGSPRSG